MTPPDPIAAYINRRLATLRRQKLALNGILVVSGVAAGASWWAAGGKDWGTGAFVGFFFAVLLGGGIGAFMGERMWLWYSAVVVSEQERDPSGVRDRVARAIDAAAGAAARGDEWVDAFDAALKEIGRDALLARSGLVPPRRRQIGLLLLVAATAVLVALIRR